MVMARLCVVCVYIFQGYELVFGESPRGNWRWPAAEGSGPGGHRVSCQSAGLAVQPATAGEVGVGCTPDGAGPLK